MKLKFTPVPSMIRAEHIAIETGLIPRDGKGGWDTTTFEAFWERFEAEVLQQYAVFNERLIKDAQEEARKRRWWVPVAISVAAIAISLIALMTAGTRR